MNPQVVSVIYVVALFALLYFLFIRPQQKRQKEHQKMINELKVHDEVATVGGIIGTVVRIKEETVVLRLGDNVKVEFLKNAIGQVRKKANGSNNEKKE
ncbi:preprotein translocase subunit YajC [Desulfohalotomaculum tongense]|uniref:preprotein translocase subunit YajC n=1 Tax=Desulforadius tongensis TaxID=1216062 RepID=UPI001959FB4F|nr:preprotein translocase subunit YajC [Desulforadius tongensis]MBM7855122.1 preprotein translocase subunit YajC [Desulforadius tongensis]